MVAHGNAACDFADVAGKSDVHLPKLLFVEFQHLVGCRDAPLFKVGLVLSHFKAIEPLVHSVVVKRAGGNRRGIGVSLGLLGSWLGTTG